MQLTCRFYKNQFPETDDLVMVNVTEIEEMGVYVKLLEYSNKQGMILLTELTRRRIRSIIRLIRVGRNEVVLVVRVDRDKGYIDLSKRRVSPEEIIRCEEKFARGKTVNSILRHTAEVLHINTNEEFEELYDKTAWFLDEKYKRIGAAYDAFVRAVSDERELDDCPIDENTKKILLNNIRTRLTPQSVKCRADVEVACYDYDGIDAVKAALREGLNESTEELPIKINLIAPPLYVITTTCFDRNEGINVLNNVIKKIKHSIEKYRGIFKVKMEPKVVTDVDNTALEQLLIDAEKGNIEIPGDDTDDSNEDGDGGIKGKLPGENESVDSIRVTKKSNTISQTTTTYGSDEDSEEEDED